MCSARSPSAIMSSPLRIHLLKFPSQTMSTLPVPHNKLIPNHTQAHQIQNILKLNNPKLYWVAKERLIMLSIIRLAKNNRHQELACLLVFVAIQMISTLIATISCIIIFSLKTIINRLLIINRILIILIINQKLIINKLLIDNKMLIINIS